MTNYVRSIILCPQGGGVVTPPDDSDVPWLDVKIITEVCKVCQHSNVVLNHRRNEGACLCLIYHNIIA